MTAGTRPFADLLMHEARTAAVVYGSAAGLFAVAALVVGLATYQPPPSSPVELQRPAPERQIPATDPTPVKGGAPALVAQERNPTAAAGRAGAASGLAARGMKEQVASAWMNKPVHIGTVLPTDIKDYEIPAEYGGEVRRYRYTVVNDRAVLVDPRTKKVIQFID